jgi:hypothetical protein
MLCTGAFLFAAALATLRTMLFVVWNRAFEKRAGVSEKVLAQAQLTSLLLLDESYGGTVLQDPVLDHLVRFVPCVLKKPVVLPDGRVVEPSLSKRL